MRDALLRLTDMLAAIRAIRRHVTDEEEFRRNEVLQGFAVYQLMIMGEAAYKMPPAFAEQHPEIPWRSVAGMRHVLVHGYFTVDLEIVWGIVWQELPAIQTQIENILG